ncbi:MAG: AbrB/MazE/SpoVT family DNA-binding domain-containing protein [Solirubrobacteraceae bacterium]
MTYKVGPKGQVVIPKDVRLRLGIHPGDEVVVDEDDGVVRIRPAGRRVRLLGLLAGVPGGGTEALEASRREDRKIEERKLRRLPS